MSVFSDKLFTFTDAGDGATILVTDESGSTFNLDLGTIDQLLKGGVDPTQCYGYNVAVRLSLNGLTTCRNADKSGVSAAALAILNAASFKGY